MDYEKAYKDALERARKYNNVYKDHTMMSYAKGALEDIFPELKESENEIIRKEIINYFKCQSKEEPSRKDIHNKWIAWLEKQGKRKQKQYDIDVLEKHITKDSISDLAHTVIVRNGWEIVDAKEQKPTWSEEDELMLTSIVNTLKLTNGAAQMKIDWLKSLKPQPHWKPTEEQLMALRDAIDNNEMELLYNDLKKL